MFAPWFKKKYFVPLELWDATTSFDWRLALIVALVFSGPAVGAVINILEHEEIITESGHAIIVYVFIVFLGSVFLLCRKL